MGGRRVPRAEGPERVRAAGDKDNNNKGEESDQDAELTVVRLRNDPVRILVEVSPVDQRCAPDRALPVLLQFWS